MSRPSLKPKLLIQGNNAVRIFDSDGVTLTTQPVPQFIEFEINNIVEGQIKEINLHDFFDCDLIARGLTADIAADDKETLSAKGSMPSPTVVESIVDVLDGDRVENRLKFHFTSFPDYVNHIVINHRRKWKIRTNYTVNKLTFFCEMVHVFQTIRVP